MKIHIEIVTGFLGSGKTSFINSLISESQVEGEKILVFQLEDGEKKILQSKNQRYTVTVQMIDDVKKLKERLLNSINEFKPNRIIIEYNGTVDLKYLFDIVNEKIYRDCCKITTIFFVADGKRLKQYIDNLGSFIIPSVQNADMMIINNIDSCKKDILDYGIKKLKEINSRAYILKVNNPYILKSTLRDAKVLDNGYLKKLKIKIINYKKNN